MKIDYKRLGKQFLLSLLIILLFSLIDYFFHTLSIEYSVPPRYFINKIIFGTVYATLILYFTNNKSMFKRSLIFSSIIAILLQIRYYLEGYPKGFVFLFLFIHFVILLLFSLIALKILNIKNINV